MSATCLSPHPVHVSLPSAASLLHCLCLSLMKRAYVCPLFTAEERHTARPLVSPTPWVLLIPLLLFPIIVSAFFLPAGGLLMIFSFPFLFFHLKTQSKRIVCKKHGLSRSKITWRLCACLAQGWLNLMNIRAQECVCTCWSCWQRRRAGGGCTHTELWYLLGVSDVINEAMKHPSCSGCLPLVCTPSQDYVCVRVCVLFWSSLLNLRSEACARLHAWMCVRRFSYQLYYFLSDFLLAKSVCSTFYETYEKCTNTQNNQTLKTWHLNDMFCQMYCVR